MFENGKPYYRAYCAHCGETAEYNDYSQQFLDPFFLPDRCQGCHEYMSSSRWNNEDWKIEFGFWRREKNLKIWWNPLTWLNQNPWGWVEWDNRDTPAKETE